jgi:hypothetical protein
MIMLENVDIPGLLAVTIFFLSIGAVLINTGASDE